MSKAICKKCNHFDKCVRDYNPYCDFYDPKEQTNEEWFCQLSTEEKAKWITENLSVYADDWVKRDEKLLNPATWEKWLKEKHND